MITIEVNWRNHNWNITGNPVTDCFVGRHISDADIQDMEVDDIELADNDPVSQDIDRILMERPKIAEKILDEKWDEIREKIRDKIVTEELAFWMDYGEDFMV